MLIHKHRLICTQTSKQTSMSHFPKPDLRCDDLVFYVTFNIPNNRTYPYKRTFVVFRLQPIYLYLLLYKSICCAYSFELPRQVEAIQMSTHSICFYIDNQKQILQLSIINKPFMKSSANLSLKCALIRYIFSKRFSSNFEKPKRTVR